jgi:hypothetical protein
MLESIDDYAREASPSRPTDPPGRPGAAMVPRVPGALLAGCDNASGGQSQYSPKGCELVAVLDLAGPVGRPRVHAKSRAEERAGQAGDGVGVPGGGCGSGQRGDRVVPVAEGAPQGGGEGFLRYPAGSGLAAGVAAPSSGRHNAASSRSRAVRHSSQPREMNSVGVATPGRCQREPSHSWRYQVRWLWQRSRSGPGTCGRGVPSRRIRAVSRVSPAAAGTRRGRRGRR